MKKKFLYAMIGAMFLAGCTSCSNNSNTDNNQSAVVEESPYLYTDSDSLEIKDAALSIDSCRSYGSDSSYSVNVNINIKNTTNSAVEYTIKNASIIKEDTKATYTIGAGAASIKLDAEIQSTMNFSSIIPTDISDSNYYLTFEINKQKVTIYLYETPDSLRVDRTVSYYIGGKVVASELVKDKRTLSTKYVYESEDHQSFCTSWYADSSLKESFNYSTFITEDISLYGAAQNNLTWMSLTGDAYSFTTGINHVPSDGILVIPDTYQNKEICIGINSIRKVSVEAIYVPKTVHTIYMGNFEEIGDATIYYEGSSTEWAAIFYDSSYLVTKNVVYNTKYQG